VGWSAIPPPHCLEAHRFQPPPRTFGSGESQRLLKPTLAVLVPRDVSLVLGDEPLHHRVDPRRLASEEGDIRLARLADALELE
jgi:hypothetical protein